MELRTLLLCCTLISSVAAFTLPDDLNPPRNSQVAVSQSDDCKCKNGRCLKDSRGKTKCNCNRGYALQDENTCEPCDCGKLGKCLFIAFPTSEGKSLYIKKCVCDTGSAENGGICVDCQCGKNSKCEFEDGEKICYCNDGYAEKDGICTKCDCGNHGECSFQDGQKKCTCDEDFEEINGYCVDKCDAFNCQNGGTCKIESGLAFCECADRFSGTECETDKCSFITCYNGGFCNIQDGEPICNCPQGYYGKECEIDECSSTTCENGGECFMNSGRAVCKCLARYEGERCEIDKCSKLECKNGGTCLIENGSAICKCPDAYSGIYCETHKCENVKCQNDGYCDIRDGNALCICKDRYTGTRCEVDQCDYLNCQNGGTCVGKDGKAICECTPQYIGDNCETAVCSADYPCQNGGFCEDDLCKCLPGTSGGFCDVIDECPNLCPERSDINCTYNIKHQKAYCECLDRSLSFYPDAKECRNTCDEVNCKNGGECKEVGFSKFCSCLEGTSGDLCETVNDCPNIDCGNDATCLYDPNRKSAFCQCPDKEFVFDSNERKCRKPCDSSSDCKNGGACMGDKPNKFCQCLNGTMGDLCEKIPACDSKNCGKDAKCIFDIKGKYADCLCSDHMLAFDEIDKKCKKSCTDDSVCKNGGNCKSRGRYKFCDCKVGTSGHFCEKLTVCERVCGTGVKCVVNKYGPLITCLCDDRMYYNEVLRTCKDCNCGENALSCRVKRGKKTCICARGYRDIKGVCQKSRGRHYL